MIHQHTYIMTFMYVLAHNSIIRRKRRGIIPSAIEVLAYGKLNMELKCLKCGCEGAYKYGHMKGYQRYRCKNCGYQFTKTTPQGKPEKDKILALILYLSGLSMSATGRILDVTAQSVMRWIRKMYDKFITEKPDISAIKEVEMDEMHHYYQKKLKNYGPEKLLIIEAKTSSGELLDIVIQKP